MFDHVINRCRLHQFALAPRSALFCASPATTGRATWTRRRVSDDSLDGGGNEWRNCEGQALWIAGCEGQTLSNSPIRNPQF